MKGQRVDKWLSERYPALSNRHIDEAIQHGLVTGPKKSKLKKGDKITHRLDAQALDDHLIKIRMGNSQIKGIKIIHKKKEFLVIDKPVGIPSHPLGLFDDKTVTNWVLATYPEVRNEFKDQVQPTLCPHRLDTDTSGLLVVCLNRKSYEVWRKLFQKKAVTKTYQAWCWGKPKKEEWEVATPIGHDLKDRSKMIGVSSSKTTFRPPLLSAKTTFKVINRREDRFLVQAEMRTGVTHQVRVHLAMSGYPLVGDAKYDAEFAERNENIEHHLLRAVRLNVNTGKGDPQEFECDVEGFTGLFN